MSSEDIYTPRERASIAAQLAALGEPPLDDDELCTRLCVGADAPGPVRTVATLVSLAQAPAQTLTRPLSEIELARVYRRVVTRRAPSLGAAAVDEILPSSRRSLVTALTVVAAAAAFVVIPLRGRGVAGLDSPHRRGSERAADEGLGAIVRASLDTMGPSGSARARALADDYAARMPAPASTAAKGGSQ